MEKNLISVVIPCKNEGKYIGRTLEALKGQSILTAETPIYIADAGSTDNTIEIINSYKDTLNIEIIKGGLPAIGRNNGARNCNSKYLLFLDADIILGEKKTLERVVQLAEQQNLDLVTTDIKSLENTWRDYLIWKAHTLASRTKWIGSYGTGMFIFIKCETFWACGGFNEEIHLGEDWDLTHQVPPHKFAICDTYIYTSNRRFVSQGYIKTILQYILVAISKRYRQRKHIEYFDVNYN